MKKHILFIAMALPQINCHSQNKSFMEGIHYFTAASNYRVAEISVENGKLSLTEKRGNTIIESSGYMVEKTVEKAGFELLYVQQTQPLARALPGVPQNRYSLFVFAFSKDKTTLSVLHENRILYASLDECEQANRDVNFNLKYFYTCYDKGRFASLLALPGFANADKEKATEFVKEFDRQVQQSRDKILNTKIMDIYGVAYLQDITTRSMINIQMSPAVTIQQWNNKLAEYHLAIEKVPNYSSANKREAKSSSGLAAPRVGH